MSLRTIQKKERKESELGTCMHTPERDRHREGRGERKGERERKRGKEKGREGREMVVLFCLSEVR